MIPHYGNPLFDCKCNVTWDSELLAWADDPDCPAHHWGRFREDGWPLCPSCGADAVTHRLPEGHELTWHDDQWLDMPGEMWSMIQTGCRCRECGWHTTPMRRWRDHKTQTRIEGMV